MKVQAFIDDIEVADSGTLNIPGLRVNYFNCPWTLSNPGHGRLLLTAEAYAAFNEQLSNNGKSVLKLTDGEREMLLNVFPTKAEPLWGHFANDKGLYILEVQDERCIDAMRVVDDLTNSKLAIYNVKKLDGDWVQTTLKAEDTPWTLEDILLQVLGKMNYSQSTLPDPFPNYVPQSVYLGCLPANLAADLLLLTMGEFYVFKYDPINQRGVTCKLIDGYAGIESLIDEYKDRVIAGGKGKLYPAPNVPEKLLNYTDLIVGPSKKDDFIRDVTISTYYVNGSVIEDTAVPTLTNRTKNGSAGSQWFQYKLNAQYRYAFAGFLPAFMEGTLPIEQVVFTWQSGIPITEIHTGLQSPAQAVTSSPYYYKSRGIPHRLFIGGDIFLPEGESEAAEGGGGFWGKIIECDKQTGWARVKLFSFFVDPNNTIPPEATGPEIKAWNGPEAWHRKDDVVCCVKAQGGPGYVIVDKVKGYSWTPPGEWVFKNYVLTQDPACCSDTVYATD